MNIFSIIIYYRMVQVLVDTSKCYIYTTVDELDTFVDAVKTAIKKGIA